MPGALHGLRVLELATGVSGPYCGKLLGGLGADAWRQALLRSRKGREDLSYNRMMLYNALNHSKRGVSLDVGRPEGCNIFLKMAASADAVVQNFSPRGMAPRPRLRFAQSRQPQHPSKDLPQERWYREMRIRRVGEGPSEVQRLIMARDLLGGSFH